MDSVERDHRMKPHDNDRGDNYNLDKSDDFDKSLKQISHTEYEPKSKPTAKNDEEDTLQKQNFE